MQAAGNEHEYLFDLNTGKSRFQLSANGINDIAGQVCFPPGHVKMRGHVRC